MKNKELIYSTSQEYMANLIKGSLEAEGIPVLLLNQQDSAYTVFGTVELYVKPEDVIRAKFIIDKANEE